MIASTQAEINYYFANNLVSTTIRMKPYMEVFGFSFQFFKIHQFVTYLTNQVVYPILFCSLQFQGIPSEIQSNAFLCKLLVYHIWGI